MIRDQVGCQRESNYLRKSLPVFTEWSKTSPHEETLHMCGLSGVGFSTFRKYDARYGLSSDFVGELTLGLKDNPP